MLTYKRGVGWVEESAQRYTIENAYGTYQIEPKEEPVLGELCFGIGEGSLADREFGGGVEGHVKWFNMARVHSTSFYRYRGNYGVKNFWYVLVPKC